MVTEADVIHWLEDLSLVTDLRGRGLIGCRRRGRWTTEHGKQPWRHGRGNTILSSMGGVRYPRETPVGPFDYYAMPASDGSVHLLQFRGGLFSPMWIEDALDVWSIAAGAGDSTDLSESIVILSENRGELSFRIIPVPHDCDHIERRNKIFDEYTSEPPVRINKGTPYAVKICRFCEWRARCNVQDQYDHNTADWSPAFQKEVT